MQPPISLFRQVLQESVLAVVAIAVSSAGAAEALPLGDRRELFVDHFLIERMENVRLELARPCAAEVVMRFDRPWEEAQGVFNVLKDGDTYRMYYRGGKIGPYGFVDYEVTCYAESRDGIAWTKPALGLHAFGDIADTNIILGPDPRMISTSFAAFLDERPGVPREERFKAVGGAGSLGRGAGLYRLASADGIRWRVLPGRPLFVDSALDSQNVVCWVPAENCYAIYLRTFAEIGQRGTPSYRRIRTISRSTSKDFVTWSNPEEMSFGDTPLEHLYTNGTHPYFRAPHLLIALPFRFWPDRRVQSEEEAKAFGVRASQRQGISDTVFMTSRGGSTYDRTFMESFIRPGLDRRSWHARNIKAAYGVVPTGEHEMSIYIATHNTLPSSHIRRYALPVDRFASVRAPYAGGMFVTKPLTFTGRQLVLNYSTSAAGSVRVEVLDAAGNSLPGYSAADCDEIIGDEIARVVTWNDRSDLSPLAGRPVRLRFTMADADIYSLKFDRPAD